MILEMQSTNIFYLRSYTQNTILQMNVILHGIRIIYTCYTYTQLGIRQV